LQSLDLKNRFFAALRYGQTEVIEECAAEIVLRAYRRYYAHKKKTQWKRKQYGLQQGGVD
jgi:hypothetical protein